MNKTFFKITSTCLLIIFVMILSFALVPSRSSSHAQHDNGISCLASCGPVEHTIMNSILTASPEQISLVFTGKNIFTYLQNTPIKPDIRPESPPPKFFLV